MAETNAGLVGDTPDHGYFVAIGPDTTMTGADVAAGTLIVKIGLAPVGRGVHRRG